MQETAGWRETFPGREGHTQSLQSPTPQAAPLLCGKASGAVTCVALTHLPPQHRLTDAPNSRSHPQSLVPLTAYVSVQSAHLGWTCLCSGDPHLSLAGLVVVWW